jgi:hypothetical protein
MVEATRRKATVGQLPHIGGKQQRRQACTHNRSRLTGGSAGER